MAFNWESYNGNIPRPAPVVIPHKTIGSGTAISSSLAGNTGGATPTGGGASVDQGIAAAVAAMQKKANDANEARYTQGLGVLQNSAKAALAANQQVGKSQLAGIDRQEKSDLGSAEQNAISRGLGNTTIRNSLLDQVKRRASDQRNTVNDSLAQRTSNLQLQANGPIASAIFARDDNAPDWQQAANLLAQLAQGRAKVGG